MQRYLPPKGTAATQRDEVRSRRNGLSSPLYISPNALMLIRLACIDIQIISDYGDVSGQFVVYDVSGAQRPSDNAVGSDDGIFTDD